MPKSIFISPVIPLAWLFIAIIALGVLMIWIEWKRPVRFLAARLVAVSIALIALTALLLNLSFHTEVQIKPAVVITPGSTNSVVDSLKQQNFFDFITYNSQEGIEAYRNRIHTVVGEGLPLDVFHTDPTLSFYYYGAEPSAGIHSVSVSTAVKHQPIHIEGECYGIGKKLLILADPAGVKDSILLLAEEHQFLFTIWPKTSGKLLYTLHVEVNDELVQEEKLPVLVQDEQALNILMLQSFPTFETRFLKNYLGEQGHQLALRYQVSAGIYKYEFVNCKEQPLEVTKEFLTRADLLIVTDDVLKQLSKANISALTQAVQDGLGLLLLVQNEATKLPAAELFRNFTLVSSSHDSTDVRLRDIDKTISLPTVGMRLKKNIRLQSLYEDAAGVTCGYTYFGSGKVAVQLIHDTYTLSLGARSFEYASLWQPSIQTISRVGVESSSIQITTPEPWFINQPLTVRIISAAENPSLYYQKQTMPLMENPRMDQVYETTIWPEKRGWNTVTLSDSTQKQFYVHQPGEWKSRQRAQLEKINRAHHSSNNTLPASIDEERPVSKIWLFILLILSWGFLWLSSKL